MTFASRTRKVLQRLINFSTRTRPNYRHMVRTSEASDTKNLEIIMKTLNTD